MTVKEKKEKNKDFFLITALTLLILYNLKQNQNEYMFVDELFIPLNTYTLVELKDVS